MSIISQPWPDTPYSAQRWGAMFRGGWGETGQHAHAGFLQGLKVFTKASQPGKVYVQPGAALIAGVWAQSGAEVELVLDTADPTYARIDHVVFRTDGTPGGETASILVLAGAPGPAPVAPALDQSGDPHYDLPLATVAVLASGAGVAVQNYAIPANTGSQIALPVIQTWAAPTVLRTWPVLPSIVGPIVNPLEQGGAMGIEPWKRDPDTGDLTVPPLGIMLTPATTTDAGLCLLRGLVQMGVSGSIRRGKVVSPVPMTSAELTALGSQPYPVREHSDHPIGIALENASEGPHATVWVLVDTVGAHTLLPRARRRTIWQDAKTTNSSTYGLLTSVNVLYGPGYHALRTSRLRVQFRGVISNTNNGAVTSFKVVAGSKESDPVFEVSHQANYLTPVSIDHVIEVDPDEFATGGDVALYWKTSAGTTTLRDRSHNAPLPDLSVAEVLGDWSHDWQEFWG